jgi:hypothetical protein
LHEWWNGISGTAITALTNNAAYPDNPTGTGYLAKLEIPTNTADNYGTRLRAYVIPPTSGAYTFWIAGDDNCQLRLSTNDNPANSVQIAYVSSWTSSQQWTKLAGQESQPISLIAGQKYYIEALHKEGGGGDNLAVGWRLPDNTLERPILANRLQLYQPSTNTAPVISVAPTINTNPDDLTSALLSVLGDDDAGEENLIYTWSVVGTPSAPVEIGWNDSSIAKLTTVRFTAPGSYTFQVTLTDGEGLTTTGSVSITIDPVLQRIAVDPLQISVAPNAQRLFTAQLFDQFNQLITNPPAVNWAATGGGSIHATSGQFTAHATAGGPYTISAQVNQVVGTAAVSIAAAVPVALSQTLAGLKNTDLAIELTGTDANLDALSFTVMTQPTKGTLSGTPPHMMYHPNTNYLGSDAFTFVASDGSLQSTPATITLTVYEAALVTDASSSPLVVPSAFDAGLWASDANYRATYVAQSVPGRVWQTADPGPSVPILTPIGPRRTAAAALLPTTLRVNAAPGLPVTFTVLNEGGLGAKMLSSLTVTADVNGEATVSFSLLNGGMGRIRAASPLASNFVQFTVFPASAQ